VEVTTGVPEYDVLAVWLRTQNTSGRRATLWLSKIGDIPIRYHREIPDEADIKEVTVKKESTGDWFVSFGLETDEADLPEKPRLIRSMRATASALTSASRTTFTLQRRQDRGLDRPRRRVRPPPPRATEVVAEGEGVEQLREATPRSGDGQAAHPSKGAGLPAQNHDVARPRVRCCVRRGLGREGDVGAVTERARNKQDAAWRQFITLLEYKADLYGCHVVQVEAPGTTKECAKCNVETAKPIWIREHSCPSCGLECDRDANAAMNVLKRGFSELGLGWPKDTPVETALPTDTHSVSAKRVIETGSPTLNEAAPAAE